MLGSMKAWLCEYTAFRWALYSDWPTPPALSPINVLAPFKDGLGGLATYKDIEEVSIEQSDALKAAALRLR